jgi:hypothetical protein
MHSDESSMVDYSQEDSRELKKWYQEYRKKILKLETFKPVHYKKPYKKKGSSY